MHCPLTKIRTNKKKITQYNIITTFFPPLHYIFQLSSMSTIPVVTLPPLVWLYLFQFVFISWCEPSRARLVPVNSSWAKILHSLHRQSSCQFRIISYNLKKYYPYCSRHRYLLLPCGSVSTRFPKKMQAIYLDTIKSSLRNKTYHFYNYEEVSTALRVFSRFPYFTTMFSHVCCNYSGITMKHSCI